MSTRNTSWATLFATALFASTIMSPIVRAATLEATPDKECFAVLKGEMEAEDADLVAGHIEQHAKEIAKRSLCLDSPGGNFTAGIKIARTLKEKGVTTRASDGAECFSACAVAFMGGSKKKEPGGESIADRTLHINAKLGFHAPFFVPSREGRWSKMTVERLHASALHNLAELIEMEAVSSDLLVEFARKGPNELLLIDTVDKAGRWGIALSGVREGSELTAEGARTACFNEFGWQDSKPSLLIARGNNYPCEKNCVKQQALAKDGKDGNLARIFVVEVEIYLGTKCMIRQAKDGSSEIALYGEKLASDNEFKDLASWKSAKPATLINQLAGSPSQSRR